MYSRALPSQARERERGVYCARRTTVARDRRARYVGACNLSEAPLGMQPRVVCVALKRAGGVGRKVEPLEGREGDVLECRLIGARRRMRVRGRHVWHGEGRDLPLRIIDAAIGSRVEWASGSLHRKEGRKTCSRKTMRNSGGKDTRQPPRLYPRDSLRESFVLAACPPQGRVPVVCAHTQTERRDTQEATLRTDRTLTMYLNTHRDRHLACSLLSVVVCTVRYRTVPGRSEPDGRKTLRDKKSPK